MSEEGVIYSHKPRHSSIECPYCHAKMEFETPASPSKVKVKCWNSLCEKQSPFDPANPSGINGSSGSAAYKNSAYGSTASSTSGTPKKPFKMGTAENPVSLEYYEILGLSPKATTAEIKKAYYKLAMTYHPDKNSSPGAEEMFKKISDAYQVLSDPILRKKYNEFGPGKGSDPEDGFINPEDFFKMQFGGDAFVDIIGELAIGKEFKNMMMKNMEEEKERDEQAASPMSDNGEPKEEKEKKSSTKTWEERKEEIEEKRRARDERVCDLSEKLVKKLTVYVESGVEKFRDVINLETEELKVQNYGVQLLHAVGYIYSVKASEYLAKYNDDILGMPSFVHRMRLKGRAFSDTFSTVKSAVDVHHTFVQLQQAEATGASEAEKEKLQEEAVKKGTDAIWKGSKLEIESVIKSVCDKALSDIEIEKSILRKRSEALKILGDIYQSVSVRQFQLP